MSTHVAIRCIPMVIALHAITLHTLKVIHNGLGDREKGKIEDQLFIHHF
jgi:hypothetical protein